MLGKHLERIVGEWRHCTLHRTAKATKTKFHAWLCKELLCDSVYWERDIYECLMDLVVQALLLNLEMQMNPPTLWPKAYCCRDLYST